MLHHFPVIKRDDNIELMFNTNPKHKKIWDGLKKWGNYQLPEDKLHSFWLGDSHNSPNCYLSGGKNLKNRPSNLCETPTFTSEKCLCLCIWLFVSLLLSHYHHQMISFQKIYGLYGLEHHAVEINGDVTMQTDGRTDKQQVNIELLSQWTMWNWVRCSSYHEP